MKQTVTPGSAGRDKKLDAVAAPAPVCPKCPDHPTLKFLVEPGSARLVEVCGFCGYSGYVRQIRPARDPHDKPLPAVYERSLPPNKRSNRTVDMDFILEAEAS